MPTYEFAYVRQVRTRTYDAVESLTISGKQIKASSWLCCALAIASERSRRVVETGSIRNVRTGIDHLLRNAKAVRFLNIPPNQLTERGLENLFELLESELAVELDGRAAARVSLQFRSFVLRSLPLIEAHAAAARVKFRTRFRWTGTGRKLISDLPSHPASEHRREPIGTVGGDTYQDMRTAHAKILEADLDAIRAGANGDLSYFKRARSEVSRLAERESDPNVLEFVRSTCRDSRLTKTGMAEMSNLVDCRTVEFLSVCAQVVCERRYADSVRPQFSRLEDALKKTFPEFVGNHSIRPIHLLSLPFRACTMEILSAFVLILSYTGWNSSSLCNMLIHGVSEQPDGAMRIQGYKRKTDDETPIFVFNKKQEDLYYAVKLVLWNHAQLTELGYLAQSEERLWYAWTVHDGPFKHQIISFQDFLVKFSERHKLPRFSFDQIRTQVLALTYAKSGSHELTRHMAGHANLYSLGYYINQLLSLRLASASNLEFSRRLENGVYFDVTTGSHLPNLPNTMFPTGDGSTCLDPWNPPLSTMLEGEICSGHACHAGDGCRNRRVFINSERMEELVRKRLYFRRNWQRLLAENQEKFRLFIFPSFIFVERLCMFVESGPHRDTILKIVQNVEDELEGIHEIR